MEWPVEDLTQVTGLRDRQVFNQPEKVGAGGSQWSANVVLRQTIELPEHDLTNFTQVTVELLLCEGVVHSQSLPCRSRELGE
jgi:hypothetical protein